VTAIATVHLSATIGVGRKLDKAKIFGIKIAQIGEKNYGKNRF